MDEAPVTEPRVVEDIIRLDLSIVKQLREEPNGAVEVASGTLRGWALTDEPLVALEALLGGQPAGSAALGLERPDVGELFPHIPHAGVTGFEIRLRAGRLEPDVRHATLRGRTLAGRVVQLDVPLQLVAPEPAAAQVQLHVEKCFLIDDMLQVSGWGIARSRVLTVQLFDGDELIGVAATGLSRPDIAASFPEWPDSFRAGFRAVIPLSPAQLAALTEVRVELMARDGATRWLVRPIDAEDDAPPASPQPAETPAIVEPVVLAPSSSPPTAPDLQFHTDMTLLLTTGFVRVAGWALAPGGITRIQVKYEDVVVAEGKVGLPRPDVEQAYPALKGAGTAGFQIQGELGTSVDGATTLLICIERPDAPSVEFPITLEPVVPAEAPVEAGMDAVRIAVDGMQIEAGHARRTITGSFHLVGWAVAQRGIARVEVELDGQLLGQAYHGIRREDVGGAFPDIPDALLGGFALSIPASTLRNGRSVLRVVAFDRDGLQADLSFTADVDKRISETGVEALRRHMPHSEVMTTLHALRSRGPLPMCDLVLRVGGSPRSLEAAIRTVRSVAAQAYPDWRLWVVAGGQERAQIVQKLRQAVPDHAERIQPLTGAVTRVDGLAGVLHAGDLLAVDGLMRLITLATVPADADFVYGDDRRPLPGDTETTAFFKPDWSPDLLTAQNYIGRSWLARGALLDRAKLDLSTLARIGDYAAVLRLSAAAASIRHLPRVTLEAPSREAPDRERKALSTFLRDTGGRGRVFPGAAPFLHRVDRPVVQPKRVSVIIPSIGAHGHVVRCLDSLRRLTDGYDLEVVIVDNLRGESLTETQQSIKAWFKEHADVVVPVDEPFNWSRLNNLGAAASSGDYLLFLNDDVEALQEGWLPVLMAEAERPEVGLVGAQLLYPDGKVQHAGMYLSRTDPGVGRHAFRFAAADEPGYFGLALSTRNVSCITGACMMLRREVFDRVGGFDEAHSVVNNDVDFCLRIHSAGLRVLFTPHASLRHHELASRAGLKDDYDRDAFLAVWEDFCTEGDPFHNPNLSSEAEDLVVEEEPLREVFAGHPLGDRSAIRRILVLKLDHIGDLVTGLPAFRRLKSHFPHAKLTALVGKSAVGIAQMEGAIDELIPFEFFDARSGLGQKLLTQEDYEALAVRLHEGRFDLAVDLRKLGDTRHVLKHSGAPILAGYDHDHRFPWLDIALEWERDPLQANKRNHVADDLLNLADAVANAFTEDRRTIRPRDELPALGTALQDEFGAFLSGRYAVVHPASGTPLRQWSPASFARLIDLLAEKDGVPTVLIGGPDEREIANAVLAAVRQRDHVVDFVGRSRLAELPRILAGAALFVGNNSGPSHIAAGLGVPTIAVHSAVIASEEWGPLGPNALAIRREMTCGPCYIVDVSQCHRRMACLTRISPFAVHEACSRLLSPRVGRDAGVEEPADAVSAAPNVQAAWPDNL